MTMTELLEVLELPAEVGLRLTEYGSQREMELPESTAHKILQREQWDEGIRELQELLGDDLDGMKILWELLHMVAQYSHEEYRIRSIPEDIFTATMKFCTRFLKSDYETFHTYKFVWAWWFPRQISLQEFRIGALEYEFADGEEREIAVHIPSDASLHPDAVSESLRLFAEFQRTFFPEWGNIKFTCDTWMLMPELKELLGEDSNIVAFQNLFEVDTVDYEATWYMGWIFPGYTIPDDTLPETTRLQRAMKEHLLSGKKFGIAKGHLKKIL